MPTPLLSLEPIGIGTAMMESLDSYSHRISAAHLVRRERLDLLVTSGEMRLSEIQRTAALLSVVTPSESSRFYGQRIAQLTGRHQVEHLGLSVFVGILSCHDMRRKFRSWCPECVKLARINGNEPYWPLVWSLSDYVICHIHAVRLESKCWSCGHSNVWSQSWKGGLHNCPACGKALDMAQGRHAESDTQRSIKKSNKDSYDFVASKVLGAFVLDMENIHVNSLELRNNFSRLVRHVGETTKVPTKAGTVFRLAGIPKGTGHSLAHSTMPASLRILTQLAVRFNVSLSGLLCPALWQIDVTPEHKVYPVQRRRPYRKRDWKQIESEFNRLASTQTPMSPTAFGNLINVCPSLLTRRLALDKKKLRLARVKADEKSTADKVEQLALQITAVEAEFQAHGIRISERQLSAMLKMSKNHHLYKRARALTLEAK